MKIRLDSNGRYTVFVGVTDIGAGAKTTMALIAAEALGVPLSNIEIVWGDTDRCPYSVGESGSRTTDMTGYAVIEAAQSDWSSFGTGEDGAQARLGAVVPTVMSPRNGG